MRLHSLCTKENCSLLEWNDLKIIFDVPLETNLSLINFMPFDRYSRKRKDYSHDGETMEGKVMTQIFKSISNMAFFDFNDKRLLFETPLSWETVDWEYIDLILISSELNALALPYITEYTDFRGKVFASEPCIEMMRFMMEELTVWCSLAENSIINLNEEHLSDLPKSLSDNFGQMPSWKGIYSQEDINNCMEKIQAVRFHEEMKFQENISFSAFSSGCRIGSCNWLIVNNNERVFFMAEASTLASRHPKSLQLPGSPVDTVIIAGNSYSWQSYCNNSPIFEDCVAKVVDVVCKTISEGGNVLLPINTTGIVYDIISNLIDAIDRVGSTRPHAIYLVSPSARKALLYSNISGEWLNKTCSEKLFIPEDPMSVVELMEMKKFKTFQDITEGFREDIKSPCVVFAGHPSLRMGDIVSLMGAWKGSNRNSLILCETTESISHLLAPYQPVSMKVFQIPCNIFCLERELMEIAAGFGAKNICIPSFFDLEPWQKISSAVYQTSFDKVCHIPSLSASGNYIKASLNLKEPDCGLGLNPAFQGRLHCRDNDFIISLGEKDLRIGKIDESKLVRLLKRSFGIVPLSMVSDASRTYFLQDIFFITLSVKEGITLKASSLDARNKLLDILIKASIR